MNILKLSSLAFKAEPTNYAKIDDKLSRSAQPLKEDFQWLKEQGVTDIINFRTMVVGGVDFDEESEVLKLGMKYHNIPSITNKPQLENVNKFLTLVENVKNLTEKFIYIVRQEQIEQGCMLLFTKWFKGLEH